MNVRMWASWFEPSQDKPIFDGSLDECFRRFPVTPSEERDARKALQERGAYFGGCGGEYAIRRVYGPYDYGRASNLELARSLPWWHPTRWALFLRL